MAKLAWYFACVFVCLCVCTSSVFASAANPSYDAEYLLSLGQEYNKTLLKILGRSLQVMESKMQSNQAEVYKEICDIRQCKDWTSWSRCYGDAIGDFNMSTRIRECGINNSLCTYPASAYKKQTETFLCEVICPTDCILTENGYCLEYHGTSLKNTDAEAVCRRNGGHLVNVNSQQKSDDLEKVLRAENCTTDVWIDGTRPRAGSSWRYKQGDPPAEYSNWGPTEPSNGNNELCTVNAYLPGLTAWRWYDHICLYATPFVCEYLKKD